MLGHLRRLRGCGIGADMVRLYGDARPLYAAIARRGHVIRFGRCHRRVHSLFRLKKTLSQIFAPTFDSLTSN